MTKFIGEKVKCRNNWNTERRMERESNTAVQNAAGGSGDDDEGKCSKMITCLNVLAEWYLVECIPPPRPNSPF